MLKKFFLTIAILGVVLGPILGLFATKMASLFAYFEEMEAAGMPPTSVASAVAEQQRWENVVSSVGSLRPVQGVTLSAELGGKIVEIAVANGAPVKRGDLLVRIDTSSEEAQLAAAEASVRLAQLSLERSRRLLDKETVSRAEFDAAAAAHEEAVAQADSVRAAIAKKTIRAPFDGRVGIRLVNLGQTVREGDPLIPLQALDPIYVDFSVPQQQLGQLSNGQPVRVEVQGVALRAHGLITAINPQIDPATRNVLVQATLSNPDEVLRPGMFASIAVVLPKAIDVVAIPATALIRAPYGDSVFIVDEREGGLVARQQFVRTGEARGDFISIVEGVAPGDRVVSAGAFKLRNGAPIALDDQMQPSPSLNPTPENS